MAKYYCFVGQVSNNASQPYFPSDPEFFHGEIILDDVVGVNLFQKIIHVGTDELVTVHDVEQAAEG